MRKVFAFVGITIVLGALPIDGKPLTKFRSGIVKTKVASLDAKRKILDGIVFAGENAFLHVSLVLARHPEDVSVIEPIRLPSHEWWNHVRVDFIDSTGRKVPGLRGPKLVTASVTPPDGTVPSAGFPYLIEGRIIQAQLRIAPQPAGDYRVLVRFLEYSDEFSLKVRIGNETPEIRVAFLDHRLSTRLSAPEEESVLRELTTLDTLNVEYAERLGRIELRKNDARAALVQFERALNSFNANSGGWTESAKKRDFGIWSELQRRHAQLSSTVTVLRQVASKPGLVVRATKSGSEEVFRFEDRSGNPLSTLRLR
jgi:hypothetical protein